MVQNIGTPNQTPKKYGSVNRIGTTESGRVVYQVIDPTGKHAGNMSVAANQADIFEKSYNQLLENAPKLEKYAESMDPVKIEKTKTKSKWIKAICTCIGGGIPLIKVKGDGPKGTWKQIGLTALGTVVGFVVGSFISAKVTTPPGAKEFTAATQTISKLDIQPM